MTTNTFSPLTQPTFTAIVPNSYTFTPPGPSMSKKRSRQTLDSAPPSPTPTRTTSKRLQSRHADRPTWVTSASKSISLLPILTTTGLTSTLYPPTPRSPRGCRVLCFLGSTTTHLTALAAISSLLLSSFHTPIFAISLSPPPAPSPSSQNSIPILHDSARTLTLQLGLLHPLGGGRIALDAIVVLDRDGRRRMLLPVGWGVRSCGGREMGHLVGGEGGIEVENVLLRLVKGVEWLCGEGRSSEEAEGGGEGRMIEGGNDGGQNGEEADVDMDR